MNERDKVYEWVLSIEIFRGRWAILVLKVVCPYMKFRSMNFEKNSLN